MKNLIFNDKLFDNKLFEFYISTKDCFDEQKINKFFPQYLNKNITTIYGTKKSNNLSGICLFKFKDYSQLILKIEEGFQAKALYRDKDGNYISGIANVDDLSFLNAKYVYRTGEVYTGKIAKYLPNGYGHLEKKDGFKLVEIYVGDFVDGKYDGRGTKKIYHLKDSYDKYEGEFSNGKMNGKGVYYFPYGVKCECQFLNDKPIGTMKMTYNDGKVAIGNFELRATLYGKGTIYYPQGNIKSGKGEIQSGQLKGVCELNYRDGSNYVGEIRAKSNEIVKNGKGKLILADKTSYEGTFENDKKNGFFVITYPDGRIQKSNYITNILNGKTTIEGKNLKIEVNYNNGKKHGTETCIENGKKTVQEWYYGERAIKLSNGAIWIGKNNAPIKNGEGTYINSDGTRYTGLFVNGNFPKQIKIQYVNGAKYSGAYSNGEYNGYGTMTWKNGESYSGNYVNGKRHGKGKYVWPSGNTYEGEFKNGERTGYGKFTWPNGSVYEGDFKNGERTGYGKIKWNNRDRYEGQFLNGNVHGSGTYYRNDGTYYKGIWKNGQNVSVSYDSRPVYTSSSSSYDYDDYSSSPSNDNSESGYTYYEQKAIDSYNLGLDAQKRGDYFLAKSYFTDAEQNGFEKVCIQDEGYLEYEWNYNLRDRFNECDEGMSED